MDITIRDVVGTAHVNAKVATDQLKGLLDYGNNSPATLKDIQELLSKALSDVMLARHMTEQTWCDTTYTGRWER
jgi:hypothetical protein